VVRVCLRVPVMFGRVPSIQWEGLTSERVSYKVLRGFAR
jgi:hypothetical protein